MPGRTPKLEDARPVNQLDSETRPVQPASVGARGDLFQGCCGQVDVVVINARVSSLYVITVY